MHNFMKICMVSVLCVKDVKMLVLGLFSKVALSAAVTKSDVEIKIQSYSNIPTEGWARIPHECSIFRYLCINKRTIS